MRFKTNNQTGLSLIEVLVASGIFIIGLMAMLSSSVAILSAIRFSKNYLIATGLAREAIEVVKNKRDDNYLNDLSFNDGLDFVAGAVLRFPDTGFVGKFNIEPVNYNDIDLCIDQSDDCQLHFFDAEKLYGNCNSGVNCINGGSGRLIKFYRLLTFKDILCQEAVPADWIGAGPGDLCQDGEQVGLTVTATIKWYKGDQLRFLVMTNKLYDWQ